jgi:transketolase
VRDFAGRAREIRSRLLQMHAKANASHIASSFSSVEILISLYFSILRIFPENPNHPLRDRFILSKGHAASALYVSLAFRGLIPLEWLDCYHLDGSNLPGHPDRLLIPFCEASTGSLGHGLPMGVGMAYALKLNDNASRIFVLMSDGEIQEGSVWEAANTGSRLHLDNLIAIIDANKWQAYERTDHIMPIHTFRSKWKAFGWSVREVDGHHVEKLIKILRKVPFETEKPSIVIAHTTKGKGIREFENKLEWHYRSPRPEDLEPYFRELNEKSIR